MKIPFRSFQKPVDEHRPLSDEKRARALRWGVLAVILLIAAALRLSNLAALGEANHYYAAAVKSMLQSWHNFFFVAAEPGGSVSVDKPPVGLWIQALSAGLLGVNTLGLLLPQILAGLFSIVLVYSLARRAFGTLAGLIAALVLALTPVVVATDRNNTMDSVLIFVLLLAAWAFIKATETARLRYLIVGALLVGIGFNIKMLAAYLPLPAFVALYFLGAPEGMGRKLGKLALTGGILLGISLSWAVIVDLTPANQRPYVGSSGNNSELNLIVGYNGLNRLEGRGGFRGNPSGPGGLRFPPGGAQPGAPNSSTDGSRLDGRGFPQSGTPPQGPNGARLGPGVAGGMNAGTGQAGVLRLLVPPLSKEAGWLLPFALFSLAMVGLGGRLAWPLASRHQGVVVWGGWLVTAGIFFSVAGFFHEYYLSILGPPLAVSVGMGVAELWRLGKRRPWLASLLFVTAAALTLGMQSLTARAFVEDLSWAPWVAGLFLLGSAALVSANWAPLSAKAWLAPAGYAGLVAALLLTPAVWSVLTNQHASDNQSLPAAYDGRSDGPARAGSVQINPALLAYLQAHTQGTYYLMAVPSSMQGADYVLATGRPVLYMGGFMGQDQVLTPESLATLVATGRLRYIYWNAAGNRGGGGQFGGQAEVTRWIFSQCQVVQGFDTTTHNSGAPDGMGGGTGSDGFRGGEMPVTLYDCGR